MLLCAQCKPEYKVPGLYVVDSIVRQSRHQFGAEKDVFGPRFTKNIAGTFENLCLCPTEDRVRIFSLFSTLIVWFKWFESNVQFMIFLFLLQSKIVRVLNLWQKNGVFKIEVIQPLLDMAAGSSSSTGFDSGPDAGKTLICNIMNIAVIFSAACLVWHLFCCTTLPRSSQVWEC